MFYSPQSAQSRREVIYLKLELEGGDTPHDAKDAMGRHHIGETGNIAAIQRQLGPHQRKKMGSSLRLTLVKMAKVKPILDPRTHLPMSSGQLRSA